MTVQLRNQVSDGHDGYTETWAPAWSRVPARVRPLEGRELERARQVDPRVSHEVLLRYWRNYRADLDGGRGRLVYHDVADRTFEVIAPPIDVDEAHEELRVLCREAVA